MNKKQKIIYQKICEEKSKQKPDKKLLQKLAKQMIDLDDDEIEFTGKIDEKPIKVIYPNRKPLKYGKWYSDDEQI